MLGPGTDVMNEIVRKNYPASKLPEDLRQGIDPSSTVMITVVDETPPHAPMTLEEIFVARRPPFKSKEEIDAEIRRQRDEWDD
jgi:hypothetical protein